MSDRAVLKKPPPIANDLPTCLALTRNVEVCSAHFPIVSFKAGNLPVDPPASPPVRPEGPEPPPKEEDARPDSQTTQAEGVKWGTTTEVGFGAQGVRNERAQPKVVVSIGANPPLRRILGSLGLFSGFSIEIEAGENFKISPKLYLLRVSSRHRFLRGSFEADSGMDVLIGGKPGIVFNVTLGMPVGVQSPPFSIGSSEAYIYGDFKPGLSRERSFGAEGRGSTSVEVGGEVGLVFKQPSGMEITSKLQVSGSGEVSQDSTNIKDVLRQISGMIAVTVTIPPILGHRQKPRRSFSARNPVLQRKCACGGMPGPAGECADCRKKRLGLQRKEVAPAPTMAPPIVHDVLRRPGRPLEPEARSFMENRFGHDFGKVRVHADAEAAESARAVGALAYTVGNHVAFDHGHYAPGSGEGKELLAHELAHVVQQSGQGSDIPAQLPIGAAGDHWEREADRMAGSLEAPQSGGHAPTLLSRRSRKRKSMGGFEERELQDYLQGLDRRGKIEDNRNSDEKARAIVKEWIWGISPFELTPQRKTLMIREMQSGFTGDEDERAILDLLEGSKDDELLVIFGPRGIGAKSLRSDFHGADEKLLLDFFSRRFEGGYEALRRGKVEIRKRRSLGDATAVADARRRLETLHKFEAEWTERQARRTRIGTERTMSAEKRRAMDDDAESRSRGEEEPGRISGINQRPLSIEVNEDQVVFRIRFHVRFEGKAGKADFEELRDSLERGARMVWNQRLSGDTFRGRDFFVVPEISPAPDKRDHDFWLITVRPTDKSGVNYPACPTHTAPTAFPTSATDPTCDGGVMSIPPSHQKKPDILGHELLHLFGFFDRYVMRTFHATPTGPATGFDTIPMRETKGRPDPLGAQDGKVLAEDVSLLFDRLGVYDKEESRGLETLRALERGGLTIEYVREEIKRLEELIRRGGERELLFKPRQNFIDVMTRQAEDL